MAGSNDMAQVPVPGCPAGLAAADCKAGEGGGMVRFCISPFSDPSSFLFCPHYTSESGRCPSRKAVQSNAQC